MNSPETPIYHKSHVLFNYFFARDGIYKNKKAIMVEGNFDALSLFVNGIENVVAPMGTAATVEQFLELWRSTDEIVVCFDGDIAGKKAGRRVADMLLPAITPTKIVKFALLPDNIDPDDFIKKYGKDAFEKLVSSKESCYSLSEFLFRDRINLLNIDLKNNLITPEEKGKLQVEFDNIVKNISNQVVAKNFNFFFRGELFKLTKFDGKKRVENYRDSTKINHRRYIGSSIHNTEGLKESILSIENDIFLLLINNLEMVELLYKNYNVDLFSVNFYSENSGTLLSVIFDICEQNKIADKKYLRDCLEKNNLDYYIIEGDIRFNSEFSNIISNKNNRIKYLYWLLLEKNIEQLHLEEKELLKSEGGVKKAMNIELELNDLREKKLQLEESFNF
jgi:DNA primase